MHMHYTNPRLLKFGVVYLCALLPVILICFAQGEVWSCVQMSEQEDQGPMCCEGHVEEGKQKGRRGEGGRCSKKAQPPIRLASHGLL